MAELDLDAIRAHLPAANPGDLADYVNRLCWEVAALRASTIRDALYTQLEGVIKKQYQILDACEDVVFQAGSARILASRIREILRG